jgi:hypothetical protein
MPAKPPPPGSSIAVTMPTTSPAAFSSGPPELPGFTAASNWIRLLKTLPSAVRKLRFSPETTPALTEGPMPNGKPTATTISPYLRSAFGRMVAAARSSGTVSACSTARSFSGCRLMILASDSSPSANTTRMRPAPSTTCRLVRILPRLTITTPLPLARCRYSSYSSASAVVRTCTMAPCTAPNTLAAGEGRTCSASVRCTAASTSSFVRLTGTGLKICNVSARPNTANPASVKRLSCRL